jgi:hypothetical protein
MAYQTLALGLTLTIPTSGTKNWGQTLFSTTWTKISQHKHTGSGDGNQLDTSSYSANSVTGDILAKNIFFAQALNSPAGTTQTIDFDTGNIQKLDLSGASGDVTLTFSNPATGGIYILCPIQGAVARSLVFPGNVKWPQGQAPILSTSNGAFDKITFYFDGTNFYGDWELNYS